MSSFPVPQVTLEQWESEYSDRHLLHGVVDYWADRKPNDAAIVNATQGTQLTWKELQFDSLALAGELWRMGLRKGDFLATSLPFSNEHIVLEYACFRLGVIHAPLDLRLQPSDVMRSLQQIRARAYAFFNKGMGETVHGQCDFVEFLIQFGRPEESLLSALSFFDLMEHARVSKLPFPSEVDSQEGAQVIFTTGSTGSPKPALLSHRGIACQNLALGTAFRFTPDQRVLCNLPASHVGGQAEILLTTLAMGGTAVTLETFDAAQSLIAIEQHGVTLLGQIPAMFQMEWRSSEYGRRSFQSLEKAVYGGQAVPRPFLQRMLEMAPTIATGLGLTEASGFCTYTPLTADAEAIADTLGWAMPIYPLSIRQPMDEHGNAGLELRSGEVGHVCFQGPQNFLGYVNNPEATAATLSREGWLYTGDMGYVDERGLHFSGRLKWILKPAGYQVFPGEIENHLSQLSEQVSSVGVVGHEHSIWSEGILAFVEKRPGASLTEAELRKHARSLTSYMRPLHYVILEPGTMPLNRSAKVDLLTLSQLAREEVRKLRERGRWDAGNEPD